MSLSLSRIAGKILGDEIVLKPKATISKLINVLTRRSCFTRQMKPSDHAKNRSIPSLAKELKEMYGISFDENIFHPSL